MPHETSPEELAENLRTALSRIHHCKSALEGLGYKVRFSRPSRASYMELPEVAQIEKTTSL